MALRYLGIYSNVQFNFLLRRNPGWLGTKLSGQELRTTFLHVTHSLSSKELPTLFHNLLQCPFYDIGPAIKSKKIHRLIEHVFVCSIRKVPPSRVAAALPSFKTNLKDNEFNWITNQVIPASKIPQCDNVYVGRNEIYGGTLDRSMVGHDETYYLRGRRFMATEEESVSIRAVSRHVHIWLLSNIESEDAAMSLHSDALKKAELK